MATPSAIANRHLAVLNDIRDRLVRIEEMLLAQDAARGGGKAAPAEQVPELPPMPSPKNLGSTLTRKGS